MFEFIARSLNQLGRKLGVPQYRSLADAPMSLVFIFSAACMVAVWNYGRMTITSVEVLDALPGQYGWHLAYIAPSLLMLATAFLTFSFSLFASRSFAILVDRFRL